MLGDIDQTYSGELFKLVPTIHHTRSVSSTPWVVSRLAQNIYPCPRQSFRALTPLPRPALAAS